VASRGPYTLRGTLMIDPDQKHHRWSPRALNLMYKYDHHV
jgi:hypothetical protein